MVAYTMNVGEMEEANNTRENSLIQGRILMGILMLCMPPCSDCIPPENSTANNKQKGSIERLLLSDINLGNITNPNSTQSVTNPFKI